MKIRALVATCLAVCLSPTALSQPLDPCETPFVIESYIDARDNDVPLLENLAPAQIVELVELYQVLEDAIVVSLIDAPSGSVPDTAMRNDQSFDLIADGFDAKAQAIIISDLTLTLLPAAARVDYLELTRAYIEALQGVSTKSLAELVDQGNRLLAEQTLLSDGCPHDLEADYGVPPYQAP